MRNAYKEFSVGTSCMDTEKTKLYQCPNFHIPQMPSLHVKACAFLEKMIV